MNWNFKIILINGNEVLLRSQIEFVFILNIYLWREIIYQNFR